MSISTAPVLLESGDRLSRAEFHRRYCLMPDAFRAELVEGVVYVASPTRYTLHDEPHLRVGRWLGGYTDIAPGVKAGVDGTVLLGPDSEVQPDGFLFRVPPPSAAAARVGDDDYIEGAPQLVVEVAASTASRDLHDKLRAYESAGVLEYVVWRTVDKQFDWFRLHEGHFERVEPDSRGVYESSAFPGLRLDTGKMLAGDMAGVLAELRPPAGA